MHVWLSGSCSTSTALSDRCKCRGNSAGGDLFRRHLGCERPPLTTDTDHSRRHHTSLPGFRVPLAVLLHISMSRHSRPEDSSTILLLCSDGLPNNARIKRSPTRTLGLSGPCS